jgi:hypothetical protein
MRVAVYTNNDLKNSGGTFAILIPTGELSFDATIAKDIPAGSQFKVIDLENASEKAEFDKISEVNTANVTYWPALEGNFDDVSAPISFTINMSKAIECHLNYIRTHRNIELTKLDIEYQRADESGDAALKAAVVAKKEKLRNMPSDTRIVNCSDFDTLKTLTYEYLRDN